MSNITQTFIRKTADDIAKKKELTEPVVFVPFVRLIATPDNWKRIQEYAAIPSPHE